MHVFSAGKEMSTHQNVTMKLYPSVKFLSNHQMSVSIPLTLMNSSDFVDIHGLAGSLDIPAHLINECCWIPRHICSSYQMNVAGSLDISARLIKLFHIRFL